MKTYMIRTCPKNMKSYKGTFTWPESGPVACPDWDPKPYCGNGLHGLLLGCGNGVLLDWSLEAKWLVVEIDREDIVDLGGKIKVPKGTVIFSGPRIEAIAKLEALAPECKTMPVVGVTRTAGDFGTAIAGDFGTAIAGSYGTATAGYNGTATAGNYGSATAGNGGAATAGFGGTATVGSRGTATAGSRGTATAGNGGAATAGFGGTATAGYCGSATAGDNGSATAGACGTATAGKYGHATAGYNGSAQAGDYGTATACVDGKATVGINGKISMDWWDEKTNRRRTVNGYVGKKGIEPNKPYQVDPAIGKKRGSFIVFEKAQDAVSDTEGFQPSIKE